MNFITNLFKSKDPAPGESYDVILIMVNRLIKYAHMIPFKKRYSAEQLGFIGLNRLIRYYGMSEVYISDRDKFITSNY